MTEVVVHLDAVDGEPVWWAEAPGFTVAAGTLAEVRRLATDALGNVTERLDAPLVSGIRQTQVLLTP